MYVAQKEDIDAATSNKWVSRHSRGWEDSQPPCAQDLIHSYDIFFINISIIIITIVVVLSGTHMNDRMGEELGSFKYALQKFQKP